MLQNLKPIISKYAFRLLFLIFMKKFAYLIFDVLA